MKPRGPLIQVQVLSIGTQRDFRVSLITSDLISSWTNSPDSSPAPAASSPEFGIQHPYLGQFRWTQGPAVELRGP